MTRLPPEKAKAAFLTWLRFNHPLLYAKGAAKPVALAGFWDTVNKVFDTVSNTVVKAGTAYVQGRAALDLVKANVKRAKQGLPPINDLSEMDEPPGSGGFFGSIPPMVLYAGVGVIAYLLLRRR